MEKTFYVLPEVKEMYQGTLLREIPEYSPISIAHAVVTEGGRTVRTSGMGAVGPEGVMGKGDMGVQAAVAMDRVREAIEAAGGTWDDIIFIIYYFTDREQYWRRAVPARVAYFQKHSKSGRLPCITSIGVPCLIHPHMMILVEAVAVLP